MGKNGERNIEAVSGIGIGRNYKAMKICIDATPIGIKTHDKGGVYRYVYELITGLNSIDRENDYTLFFNFFRKQHFPFFWDTQNRLGLGSNFHIKLCRFPPRLRWVMNPPIESLAGRFDIFHGCFDYLPPILLGKGVVTIHDVRYLEKIIEDEADSEWVGILKRTTSADEFYVKEHPYRVKLFNHLRATIWQTIKRADAVITVSEFCKGRIMKLLGMPSEQISVIYHGISHNFRPLPKEATTLVLDKYKIKKNYILYTGKYDPLKNLLRLLEAFKIVTLSQDVILVIAGQINWFYYVVLEKAKQLDIVDKIVFTNFIADDELIALYSGASMFILPSLYEGFGIPPIEAMACGTPVIVSNACSLPEIVGDAGILVDPYNIELISDKVCQILDDKEFREDLIKKGLERARLFSWENTTRKTIDVYKKTYNN